MLFKEIPGLVDVKSILTSNVKESRVSHAQLFLGEEGSAALAMALAYTQYIFCDNKLQDDSCGICPSCIKVQNLVHPDLHFSFPFASSAEVKLCQDILPEWRSAIKENYFITAEEWSLKQGADNKQGLINREEGYNILKRLTLKSFEGGFKVNVMWMPETLHNTAANALLKLIEEPPAFTLLLFVSSKVEEILPTILSRTQITRIPRLETNEIKSFVQEKFVLSSEVADSVAAVSEGNIRQAIINSQEQDQENLSFDSFSRWMRLCYNRDVQKTLSWVDEIAAIGREKQKQFILYSLFIARQCMLMHYLGEDKLSVRGKELDFVRKFSPFINEGNILKFVTNCDLAFRDISRNANAKILLTDLSFKTFVLIKK